jgi:sporulation protein YlmC with PRC-barrel domain
MAQPSAAQTPLAPPTTPPPATVPPPSIAETPAPPVIAAEQVAQVELMGLLGHSVVGENGSQLGRIIDLLVDGQGRVRAVVVDVGGFMGVGNRKVALAWSALRFAPGPKGPVMSTAIPPERITSWADYIVGRPIAILGAAGITP